MLLDSESGQNLTVSNVVPRWHSSSALVGKESKDNMEVTLYLEYFYLGIRYRNSGPGILKA